LKRDEEIVIISGLAIAFVIVVYVSFVTEMDLFKIMGGEFEDFFGMVEDDEFIQFALAVEIGWELLPQTAQILGLGAITTRLLSTGINPFILGLLTATARLGGQFIMYLVGRFLAKYVFKNSKKASAMHFMHKYKFLVFLFPAWLGALGDIIMIIAGQQKISFIKIVPFLFIGNLLDAYKWIFWDLGQIEVANSFGTQQ
jgi:membrane protein YqaA with SNARE-associated domain